MTIIEKDRHELWLAIDLSHLISTIFSQSDGKIADISSMCWGFCGDIKGINRDDDDDKNKEDDKVEDNNKDNDNND